MMASKTIFVALVVAVLAGAAWHYRDSAALRTVLRPLRNGLPGVGAAGDSGRPARVAATASPPAFKSMRKCLKDGQVLYTDDACPPGSQEEAVSGGTITVFSDRPAASASAVRNRPAGKGNPP